MTSKYFEEMVFTPTTTPVAHVTLESRDENGKTKSSSSIGGLGLPAGQPPYKLRLVRERVLAYDPSRREEIETFVYRNEDGPRFTAYTRSNVLSVLEGSNKSKQREIAKVEINAASKEKSTVTLPKDAHSSVTGQLKNIFGHTSRFSDSRSFTLGHTTYKWKYQPYSAAWPDLGVYFELKNCASKDIIASSRRMNVDGDDGSEDSSYCPLYLTREAMEILSAVVATFEIVTVFHKSL